MNLNGLEKYFKTVNSEIIDFKQVNNYNETPLMYALCGNKNLDLNLSNEQFDYLIKNSDLTQVTNNGTSPLMYAFSNNKAENLNLTEEHFNYMIKNSDLKQVNKYNWSPLKLSLEYKKEENLNLNNESWKYLIENSYLSLIEKEKYLIELKKIQSELLNDDILCKIDINQEIKKNNKI